MKSNYVLIQSIKANPTVGRKMFPHINLNGKQETKINFHSLFAKVMTFIYAYRNEIFLFSRLPSLHCPPKDNLASCVANVHWSDHEHAIQRPENYV